ncbi:hypothetical protein [Rhizobium mongolense]|uniref:Uncharacterized protein n=2 Tax=Rhizobium mongolense TaxID=57676 RepID=A0ABR6IWB8_9HYPH|nr:hypothetical protein [Rhizobium mongolense]MBB4232171.1 hypothetical protein [Rhizobium mongolense]TVZ63108.1 hypothetical protein BCL32_3225 [Rhizobium mongolense USDA 1844]
MAPQQTYGTGSGSKDERGTDYGPDALKVLKDLAPVDRRPDYYLIGDFDHVDPVTEHDILWSWSQGFLTTETASMMLKLVEGDTIGEIVLQLGIPLPTEAAISPEEAAATLGDEPVDGDPLFHVRKRIRDGRLPSHRRSDVEARRIFEAQVWQRHEGTNIV